MSPCDLHVERRRRAWKPLRHNPVNYSQSLRARLTPSTIILEIIITGIVSKWIAIDSDRRGKRNTPDLRSNLHPATDSTRIASPRFFTGGNWCFSSVFATYSSSGGRSSPLLDCAECRSWGNKRCNPADTTTSLETLSNLLLDELRFQILFECNSCPHSFPLEGTGRGWNRIRFHECEMLHDYPRIDTRFLASSLWNIHCSLYFPFLSPKIQGIREVNQNFRGEIFCFWKEGRYNRYNRIDTRSMDANQLSSFARFELIETKYPSDWLAINISPRFPSQRAFPFRDFRRFFYFFFFFSPRTGQSLAAANQDIFRNLIFTSVEAKLRVHLFTNRIVSSK